MAFTVGDEVVYDGSLGHHNGRVAAASEGGPVDVQLDGIGLVRTDEASLSDRYVKGGLVPPAPSTMTNTTDSAEAVHGADGSDSAYLPTPRPGVVPEPLGPPAGFAHNDLATPPATGSDPAEPPTEA